MHIYLVGSASGIAGARMGSGDGPPVLQKSEYLAALDPLGIHLHWQAMLKPLGALKSDSRLDTVADHCHKLAQEIEQLVQDKRFFTVLGGDHSCAIGTWSGAFSAIKNQGSLGLIWIDAHLDSHTTETSPSGNIHGMPVASLLGFGESSLAAILQKEPKLKPENICLIGIRSYESAEMALLNKLNVWVVFMDEVKQKGLDIIMQEAINIAKKGTAGFGISIDIDSIDPEDAPGTGTPVAEGLRAKELYRALGQLAGEPKLIGAEITEFDPHLDQDHMTEKLISNIIASIHGKSMTRSDERE